MLSIYLCIVTCYMGAHLRATQQLSNPGKSVVLAHNKSAAISMDTFGKGVRVRGSDREGASSCGSE